MFNRAARILKIRSSVAKNLCHSYSIQRDTIFALSSGKLFIHFYSSTIISDLFSGFGKCGVAVIRVSGPQAPEVLRKITKTQELKPRYAKLLKFFHPITGELIDKGLTLWFAGKIIKFALKQIFIIREVRTR